MTDFAILFDADWYLQNNPDVADAGVDPLEHFLADGWRDGRDPHPMFDTSYYLEQNPDVLRADYNPLIHYDRHGWRERRKPHPEFDTAWYLESYPDVAEAEMNPLQHFIEYGAAEGRRINPRWQPRSSLEYFAGIYGERRVKICQDATQRFAAPAANVARTAKGPLISILTPVYKTPLALLDHFFASLQNQTYENWELCIVDDGSNSKEIRERLEREASRDHRIKAFFCEKNGGISAASNIALGIAKGIYVGLLDHDDMLTWDALECVAKEIEAHPDTNFIYSDECKIDERNIAYDPFPKPDWSPYLLLNSMYTGHFSVYRKSIVEEVGGFRSRYDFAQDHDLALRISERTRNVRHIRRILYGWRSTAGSHATGDKPYAREATLASLQDFADRRGIKAVAVPLFGTHRLAVDPSTLTDKIGIIIPSDNIDNIRESIASIVDNSTYQNYEIIVVTNSAIVDILSKDVLRNCRFARYDEPFNFSDKCNLGAAASDADYVLFYNDDVRVLTPDWMQVILECFKLGNAGIVGPKLIYENGTIQHAGMVTGVRRLIGTAFHGWTEDEVGIGNLVLSMREVSLICGACLAMPKKLFDEIGGFNAVDTPIAHSDIDLCFKVRDKGYTCVYTPHATLLHIGHMSIGAVDLVNIAAMSGRRGKSKVDVFVMKGWPEYIKYDPYFPPMLRDFEYRDAPEEFEVYANVPGIKTRTGKDILIFSNDLSLSGAPRVAVQIAEILKDNGHFVTVLSPLDGPYRQKLIEAGITVVVDSQVFYERDWTREFALNFDLAIVSTIVGWPLVSELGPLMKVYWYLQEDSAIHDVCRNYPGAEDALSQATQLWANSNLTAHTLASFNKKATLLEYGYEPVPSEFVVRKPEEPVVVIVCGTYEERKGQDIAVESIKLLPPNVRKKVKLRMFGRTLKDQSNFYSALLSQAAGVPEVEVNAEIPTEQVMQEILKAHIVLVPSRSDAVNLVAIDGMRAGKVVIVSPHTGASEYILNGQSGYIAAETSAKAIAESLTAALNTEARWREIGKMAQEPFNGRLSAKTFAENVCRLIGV